MTAEFYIRILESNLLGTMEECGVNAADIIFQQDNYPQHTPRITSN